MFLSSPTAIIGVVGGVSPSNYDDLAFPLNLPFPVTLYNQSSANLAVSVNGWVGIIGNGGDYNNFPLPSYGSLADTAFAVLWDDLYIYSGTEQGIYYQIDGQAPTRTLTIEWYTSHYQAPSEYYHFAMTYHEASPNGVTYDYFQVSDLGGSATVGSQSQTGQFNHLHPPGHPVLRNS